jgi:hypothetical protein
MSCPARNGADRNEAIESYTDSIDSRLLNLEFTMNTYFIYSPQNWSLLGEIQAVDPDAAELLASHLWTAPVKVLTYRLRLHQTLAA